MTERKDLIVGNWKMNSTHLEAIQMVQKLFYRLVATDYDRVEVVVGPPFTSLRSIQTVIESDSMPIGLAAQNVYWEAEGAFTGEVSPPMLAELRVGHIIVGHSERRAYFGETDETVNKRVKATIAHEMKPIVCVGETLDQREADQTAEVLVTQVKGGLNGVPPEDVAESAIAYEPVWAIGTGRHADADTAGVGCGLIRSTVAESHGDEAAGSVRILYGGSVSPGNIKDFMAKRDIDGALVGGASLDPDTFAAVVRYWE
ncbi:MAG: triose-phosphate isomerase [Acidimicrobiia bacterium]|nr:triose-phosphate isomerase [Acidimicrobiia bacterium]